MKKLIMGICLICFLSISKAQFECESNKDSILSVSTIETSKFLKINDWIRDYMQSNLNYPQLAIENGVEGEVVLLVTILKNEKVDSVKVLEGIGFGCDEEAVRLVRNMLARNLPFAGESIDSRIKLKIRFRLI